MMQNHHSNFNALSLLDGNIQAVETIVNPFCTSWLMQSNKLLAIKAQIACNTNIIPKNVREH